MSKEKFTKGPWVLSDGKICIESEVGRVAYVYSGEDIQYTEKVKANARIIAAAPELYEALKPFANYACGCGKCHNCIAKNILEKARGE